jgi:peptidoglycan/LPS O-acetylase OafA/YrhL
MAQLREVNPTRSWSRVDGIDLLRGLAIFFVLMNHVNMQLLFAHVPYTRGLPKQLASSLVWNGQQGVQIFFAVSGFLITATILRRWKSLAQVSVADFYRLRFARIAPLLLGLLAILSVLHVAQVKHFVVSAETGGLGRALFAALTFHVNWLEASRGYLPGNWDILWSLSVEETFYLAFPCVCRLFGRGWLLIALLLVFVVLGPFGRSVLTHGNPVWREYSYLGGMDAIAMGCLTAIALHGRRLSRRWLRWLGGMGWAVLAFCLLLSRTAEAWIPERTGLYMTLVGIGASMLVAVAAQTG